MKLKKKIFILHVFISLIILIVFFLFYKFHFTASLTKLKIEKAEILIKGVETLLEKEVLRIKLLSDDTASWDTMYRYVINPTREIESDMAPYGFIKYMRLSLYSVISNSGDIVLLTGYNRNSASKIEFEQLQNKKGEIWEFFLESIDLKETHDHLISTPLGIMIVVSSPILRSDSSGTSRGRVLIGHIIDEIFFNEVSQTLGEKIYLNKKEYIPDSLQLPTKSKKFKLYENSDYLELIQDRFDTHGKYAFTYSIKAKKNITKTFKNIIYTYTAVIILIFSIAAFIIYYFLNRFVLKRIELISEKTTRIVTSEDLTITFPINSNDEICQLKRNLNDMLKRMKIEISKTFDAQNMLMLNEKMIFLGNITANIAHEVINPLFAVSNAVEYIRSSEYCNDKKLIEAVNIIEKETARVREISMNLNRYSIQKTMTPSKADLIEIIDASIMVAKWSRNIDKIKFHFDMPAKNLSIYCNPGAIQQVFINLILNAIDAMKGTGNIWINISEERSLFMIEFKDNGPGFDQKIIDNAFDSFKSTKNGKGAGLGLYISYNIIKDHGGSMIIDRKNSDGAGIMISIPKRGRIHDEK